MNRTILLVAAMLITMPAALAHVPPAPDVGCTPATLDNVHDYGAPVTGNLVWAHDGNLADCAKPNPIEVGLFSETGTVCTTAGGAGAPLPPPVCGSVNTGVDQPLFDYDGELEFANGGAFLFVNTGDGVSSGVTACFGWPSVGHHGTSIYAQDVLGAGPQFTVTSDYARAGLEDSPDCGDSYVEACDPTTPVPSTQPFPVNVVVDAVNAALYSVFGPGGAGCNPLDGQQRFASNTGGASGGAVGFGPGADGALVVFVEIDTNTPIVSQAGHIWTA